MVIRVIQQTFAFKCTQNSSNSTILLISFSFHMVEEQEIMLTKINFLFSSLFCSILLNY